MKLLFCKEGGDIVKLTRDVKSCSCGQVSGRYINDLDAEVITGASGVVLEAFILPKGASTVRLTAP